MVDFFLYIDESIFLNYFFLSIHLLIFGSVLLHLLWHPKESSQSTLLWIIAVFSFPLLGGVLYLFFGISRTETLGQRIEFAAQITQRNQNNKSFSPARHALIAKTKKESFLVTLDFNRMVDRLLPHNPPLMGNHVTLLIDGSQAYPEMQLAIQKAKKMICLQSYLIMDDPVGKTLFDLLAEKAKQGVLIRILYDRVGSWSAVFRHFFSKYQNFKYKNLEILPFSVESLFEPWRFQLRNHRKLLVIDGKIAFVGGLNIGHGNLLRKGDANEVAAIHDLHTKMEGPVVAEFQSIFLRDWYFASKQNPNDLFSIDAFPSIPEIGKGIVRVVDSGPGQNNEASENLFYSAVMTAKRSVWLMTPYFVPDKSFVKMLQMVSSRGVEIRILLPLKNNHLYIQYAMQALYNPLLNAGVRIFEKEGIFSHAKAMIIDGEFAIMGSSNCDIRSFKLNYELDFVVEQPSFVNDLHYLFLQDLAQSREITLAERMNISIYQQFCESFFSLFSPIF